MTATEDRVALGTARLELRPWRAGDIDDVLGYAGDPEFGRYLPIPSPYTLRDAEEYVGGCLGASWDVNPRFAIVYERHVVGSIDLRIAPSDAATEIGYSLARPHWGGGLMTEAAGAVIDWGFRARGLLKVWATADSRNVGSWRVMEKLGMRREGYLRSHRVMHGERVDVVQYGLLRSEWRGQGAE